MTGAFMKRLGDRHTGDVAPQEHYKRDLSDASIRQGTPVTAGKASKLGERHGAALPSAPRRNHLCHHLDFRLVASRTVRQYIFVV